ncbi:unnamed protein product, partial [Brachionus calyciflorus]
MYFVIDKQNLDLIPTAKKIYWKCERPKCPSRANSKGLIHPLRDTQLSFNEETLSLLSKTEALRKMIVIERNKNTLESLVGFNAKTLSEIAITGTQKK